LLFVVSVHHDNMTGMESVMLIGTLVVSVLNVFVDLIGHCCGGRSQLILCGNQGCCFIAHNEDSDGEVVSNTTASSSSPPRDSGTGTSIIIQQPQQDTLYASSGGRRRSGDEGQTPQIIITPPRSSVVF